MDTSSSVGLQNMRLPHQCLSMIAASLGNNLRNSSVSFKSIVHAFSKKSK